MSTGYTGLTGVVAAAVVLLGRPGAGLLPAIAADFFLLAVSSAGAALPASFWTCFFFRFLSRLLLFIVRTTGELRIVDWGHLLSILLF